MLRAFCDDGADVIDPFSPLLCHPETHYVPHMIRLSRTSRLQQIRINISLTNKKTLA